MHSVNTVINLVYDNLLVVDDDRESKYRVAVIYGLNQRYLKLWKHVPGCHRYLASALINGLALLRHINTHTTVTKMSHGHGHGCCGHEHDHDDASGADRGSQFSLYMKIDTERVECLNEAIEGSGKLVFKPWDQRLDTTQVQTSLIIAPYL